MRSASALAAASCSASIRSLPGVAPRRVQQPGVPARLLEPETLPRFSAAMRSASALAAASCSASARSAAWRSCSALRARRRCASLFQQRCARLLLAAVKSCSASIAQLPGVAPRRVQRLAFLLGFRARRRCASAFSAACALLRLAASCSPRSARFQAMRLGAFSSLAFLFGLRARAVPWAFSSDAFCFALAAASCSASIRSASRRCALARSAAWRSCSALSRRRCASAFSAAMRSASLWRQRVAPPRSAQLPGVAPRRVPASCSCSAFRARRRLRASSFLRQRLFSLMLSFCLATASCSASMRSASRRCASARSAAWRSCSARARRRCASAFSAAMRLASFSGKLFGLNAFSFRRCASARSAAWRSCSILE